MRTSLLIAAGLLATNLALLDRDEPARHQVQPAATPRIVSWTTRVPRDEGEAQRLAWLWHAKHAAYAAPKCEQYDPLTIVDADLDATPGREHVIGNRRFGIAMYAESGTLIAHMDPVGCVAARDGDQSLSLSFANHRLIVRTRQLEHDGEHLDAHIVERRGDELVTLLTLDVGGNRAEAAREWQVEGVLDIGLDEVLVKHHGRERSPGGTWREVDDHCTWKIATRSSSCHRRARERTSAPE